jgi:hypothetical protein
MSKWNDDSYGGYIGLSLDERKAIQALFHGTPEAALHRIRRRELPPGLTRGALRAYDRIALANIQSGEKAHPLMVFGRVVGVMAFRRELIQETSRICTK